MRKKLEFGIGVFLILIAIAGIPSDWKVVIAAIAGCALIVISFLDGSRFVQRQPVSAQSPFVDAEPCAPVRESSPGVDKTSQSS
jgi:hypothetical protein